MAQISNVLVCGGGIAGCAAAIALAQQGAAVTVLEKQDAWRFHSSGIFIYHNGLRALEQLGVLPQILAAGFAIEDGRNVFLDQDGAPIVDTFYPSAHAHIPPIVGIKRAVLHQILATRMQQLGVAVRLGTTLATLTDHGAHVTVQDSQGAVGNYDLVLGCDGIRSQLRQWLKGPLEPRYTGLGVWRSVHRRPPQLRDKIMQMGRGKRLGIMPISADSLYIFGTVAEPQGAWYAPQDWPALMRERFAEFGGPVRPLLDEIGAGSDVLYTAIEEVAAPLPWHRGRVAMLGDAAHACTPFMGQGGAMALEDAVALAEMLALPGEVPTTLAAWAQYRSPICQFVQEASRKVGDAGANEAAEQLATRNAAMQRFAQAGVDDFYAQLAALSARPR